MDTFTVPIYSSSIGYSHNSFNSKLRMANNDYAELQLHFYILNT